MLNSEFSNIFDRAAQLADRPPTDTTISALQAAEITARKEKLTIPFESLLGEWRLCFATGANKDRQRGGIKLGSGYYLPQFVRASISFAHNPTASTSFQDRRGERGIVTNQLLVGGIQLKFTGPCHYPGKKNLLIFDFTQIELHVFGKTIYQGKIRSGKDGSPTLDRRAIAKLPFFAFFWAGDNGIAARGRGGGLALWVGDNST
jgi:hypothetical protein